MAFLTLAGVQDLRLEYDGRLLAEGVDYQADRSEGTVLPIAQVPPFVATAIFSAVGTRYDIVCTDSRNQDEVVVRGPERGFDVADHRPLTPAGFRTKEVWHVGSDTQVLRMSGLPDLRWVEEGRARMPNLARLLHDHQPVRLLGYGTSLTAQGGPRPSDFLVPNGASRDCLEFYYVPSRLAEDTVARIPTQGRHVHVGFNWALKAAIERHSPCTYFNLGISGTTAADGETRNGYPNGNNKRRLAAARDLKADVVVVEYCINDLDDPDHKERLVAMIEALRGPAIDVVVLGCPGFSAFRSEAHWVRGEAAARAAADETGAAFVPFGPLIGPGNEQVMGLARRTLCSANGINHPGPTEMRIYGHWLAKIVP